MSDAEYRVFESLHRYDASHLDARVERTVDDSTFWRRETVSVAASYGNERALAHVFLPTGTSPPYQAVITLGGITITDVIRRIEGFDYLEVPRPVWAGSGHPGPAWHTRAGTVAAAASIEPGTRARVALVGGRRPDARVSGHTRCERAVSAHA